MVNSLIINGRKIGFGHPCFVIAEAGVNHNGSVEMAKKLIDAAVEAKADAVKFQTFQTEALVVPSAPKAQYQMESTNKDESQYEMLKKLELSPETHQILKKYCEEKGIIFMSTPFEEKSADLLDEIGVGVFKIPSGELTNPFFLAHVAKKKKPMIVSTGMATLAEVSAAVQTIKETGNKNLILLHCVSNYPADPADANLRAMQTMEKIFQLPIGFSDHTVGMEVALCAVALGACVIEKHFTLDCTLPGPDHKASIEPEELKKLVRSIRTVEMSLGTGFKEPAPSELDTAKVARKSLVAVRDIPVGSRLMQEWIDIRRPGTGLHPAMLLKIVGRITRKRISAGEILTLEMFI